MTWTQSQLDEEYLYRICERMGSLSCGKPVTAEEEAYATEETNAWLASVTKSQQADKSIPCSQSDPIR